MRPIDGDALKAVFEEESSEAVCGVELCKAIIFRINEAPTVEAAPSEKLYDFIREIGAITYGKERFFYENVGVWRDLWYDRKSGEWITTQTAIEECLKAVRELDDCDIDAAQHGKWIDIDEQTYTWKVRCSCCGNERSMMSTQGKYPNYCEACGAKMVEDE